MDTLQRLHAAVDGVRGDSLDDLDMQAEMSAPFVTMSRALLDVWGADMGPVEPLQVGPTPSPSHLPRPRPHWITQLLSRPQRLGLTSADGGRCAIGPGGVSSG